MYSVGEKYSEKYDCGVPSPENKSRIIYPSIHLSNKELPFLDKIKVGSTFSLLMNVRLVKKELEQRADKKDRKEYRLDVMKIGEESETKMAKALEKATESEVS